MKKGTMKSALSLHHLCSVPNFFTFMRIMLTPGIAYCLVSGWMYHAFGLFVLAAITDFFDGFFARLFNQATPFGAFLDACADKLLLVTSFGGLLYRGHGNLPGLWAYALVLIGKELLQVLGFVLLWMRDKPPRIAPTMVAKVSTFVQMIIIFWLFYHYFFDSFCPLVHYMLLSISTSLVIASLVQYSVIGFSRFFT